MDFKSFAEVDRLTIPEYLLLMEAVRYKQIDADYRNHLQAYLNFAAQATKQQGKKERPVYRKFEQFYNYKEQLDKIANKEKKKSIFDGLSNYLKKGG